MTPDRIQAAFKLLEYQQDERRSPDERRRGQFRVGWEDASLRNVVYSGDTLKRLTWRNLGHRFGLRFGEQAPDEINAVFDILAAQYEEHHSNDIGSTDITPSASEYMEAFRTLSHVSDSQIQILRLHYHAAAHTITAKQIAYAIGYTHHSVANSQYGRLGRLIGSYLEYHPTTERLGALVTFEKRNGEWHWLMRPQVAQALELLGWVEGNNLLLPEEIAATTTLAEGAVCRVSVNAYERNPEARRQCIEQYGARCCICGFSFSETYGEVADGYIHVHHLRPLSEIGKEYLVNPVEDLRPVCPNCHAVLHRRIPPYSIEEVRAFLKPR